MNALESSLFCSLECVSLTTHPHPLLPQAIKAGVPSGEFPLVSLYPKKPQNEGNGTPAAPPASGVAICLFAGAYIQSELQVGVQLQIAAKAGRAMVFPWLGPPVISARPLTPLLVGRFGSPTKIDYSKKGYPYSSLSTGGPRWVWVKIKPPGIEPQVLVLGSTYQGNQGNPFWGCPSFDPQPYTRVFAL